MKFKFIVGNLLFSGFKFFRSKRKKESFYDNLLKDLLNRDIYIENRKKEILEDIHISYSYGFLSKGLNIVFIINSLIFIKNIKMFLIFLTLSIIFLILEKLFFKRGFNLKTHSFDNSTMFIDMLYELEKY